MRQIKEDSEINPNSKWVRFDFNTDVVGEGFLTDDEEKRILLKLQNEGVIKIHLPNGKTEQEEAILSSYTPEEFMMENKFTWIEILDRFNAKYQMNNFISGRLNYWKLFNPLYWTWSIVKFILQVIKLILSVKWKYKILSLIVTLLTLVAIDFSMAWKNVKWIINFFK